MNRSLRIITLVLVLLMLASAVACADETDNDTEITTAPSSETQPVETTDPDAGKYDDEGFLLDDLPEGLNFGKAVTILYWEDTRRTEFEVEKMDGNIISDAVYERNMRIEERLGVELVWQAEPGDNDDKAGFVKLVANSYNAGDKQFDIVATYSRTAGMLAVDGYLADVNTIENNYLDFEKPWWPSNMVETVTIGDSLYFFTGDATPSILHYMTAIFYNKNLFDNLGIQYPSTDVKNDTWTLDRLIEISSNQYQDLDNDTKQSVNDFYGFTSIYYNCDAFYTGVNLRLVDKDSENLLKISDDFFSERAINLVDKLGKWLTTDTCYISRSGAAVSYVVPFAQGNALMCQLRVFMVDPEASYDIANVTWTYGIVPNPKYDSNQDEYMTIIGNPFTIYGIMGDIGEERQSISTAVMECWGSEAYRKTTPAVFEIAMKLKYSATETEAEMFDIIRDSLDFDLGRIFAADLSNMSEMPSKAMTTGGSWATLSKQYNKSLSRQLTNITDSFIKQQGG